MAVTGFLLPFERRVEREFASKTRLEGPWDLGYRGLLPAVLARSLGPPAGPTLQAGPEQSQDRGERAMLRRIESARRRSLTKLVAPISADAGGEGLDLFGAPLADSDEEADARPEEASRAALVQARALPIALAIVAHMAWLRAHNASLLIAKFPRAEWRSQDPEGADTESSDPTPQMVRRASARRCAGAGCLARARAGLPRSPAVSGRGTGRCAAC